MISFETRRSQVCLFGRVADELTRTDLTARAFDARLRNHQREAVRKDDGHFVFTDLTPSPPPFEVELSGRGYQTRSLNASWPGPNPVAIAGEDELHVIVTNVVGNTISFAPIAFVPTIEAGSQVFGEAGFTTTLAQDLEGEDVQAADLVGALAALTGTMLRIVRSNRLLLRPGATYPFPDRTTIAAFRVVDSATNNPLEGALVDITAVNATAIASAAVGGVTLFRADVPGIPPPPLPPPVPVMIGSSAARGALTDERGNAVFYFPEVTPVTSLTVSVSLTGYVTQARTLAVQAGTRSFDLVQLVRS